MKKWEQKEKEKWLKEQIIQRSYQDEVVTKINKLKSIYDISQYGSLSIDPSKYPLFIIKSKNFDPSKKNVLITGGVHGYETSGVHGALLFMESKASEYSEKFNFICTPCISPWGYETINRWNNLAIDPNRSFHPDSPAEECVLFLNAMAKLDVKLFAHFDLHETTDTDNSIFRIALGLRDGIEIEYAPIPDGFYTVGSHISQSLSFKKR
jgi:predicted deacylase